MRHYVAVQDGSDADENTVWRLASCWLLDNTTQAIQFVELEANMPVFTNFAAISQVVRAFNRIEQL